jgi:hypothetical protein
MSRNYQNSDEFRREDARLFARLDARNQALRATLDALDLPPSQQPPRKYDLKAIERDLREIMESK